MNETSFTNAERNLSGLSNALDLLELLAVRKNPSRLADIARALGISKAGAHRILSTFTSRGYVDRRPGGYYQLGIKTWEVGCLVPQVEIAEVAKPDLELACKATECSAFLVAFSDFYTINLQSVITEQAVRVHVELGSRIPANWTAGGLAFLAALPNDTLETIIPEHLLASTDDTIADHKVLWREISVIRERGYSLNLGGWRDDVGGIGAVVRGPNGQAVATINIAAPRYKFDKKNIDHFAKMTLRAAADVSAKLVSYRAL